MQHFPDRAWSTGDSVSNLKTMLGLLIVKVHKESLAILSREGRKTEIAVVNMEKWLLRKMTGRWDQTITEGFWGVSLCWCSSTETVCVFTYSVDTISDTTRNSDNISKFTFFNIEKCVSPSFTFSRGQIIFKLSDVHFLNTRYYFARSSQHF